MSGYETSLPILICPGVCVPKGTHCATWWHQKVAQRSLFSINTNYHPPSSALSPSPLPPFSIEGKIAAHTALSSAVLSTRSTGDELEILLGWGKAQDTKSWLNPIDFCCPTLLQGGWLDSISLPAAWPTGGKLAMSVCSGVYPRPDEDLGALSMLISSQCGLEEGM